MVALLPMLVVACGGTDTGASGGAAAAINLTAKGNQFSPQGFTAPANATETITVANQDSVEHNFSVGELGVSHDIEAGKSETFTFDTKGDAALVFFCKYHRTSANMVGSLTVGSGGAPGSSGKTPAASPDGNNPYGY